MNDITFYKSNIDEFNPDLNGGSVAGVIEDGVINNLMPNIRALCAEVGCERWYKFFIKANVNIINLGICISPNVFEDDKVFLAKGGSDEVESELDKENLKLYENFKVDEFDFENKKVIADRDVNIQNGDMVTFYNDDERICAYEVESVSGKEIVLKSVKDIDLKGFTGCNTILIDKFKKDEYASFWVKEVIPANILPLDNPLYFKIYTWYEKE